MHEELGPVLKEEPPSEDREEKCPTMLSPLAASLRELSSDLERQNCIKVGLMDRLAI